MIGVLLDPVFGHFNTKIDEMIILILYDLEDHLGVFQVNVLLEWEYAK
jgi:hypothetical protein